MQNIIKMIRAIGQETEIEIFVVGGYIRDYLLKKHSDDLDLTVSSSAQTFAKKLAHAVKGKYIVLHGESQIYRIAVFNNSGLKYIDVSMMQGKTILEDLKQRDFTLNALAVKIEHFDNIKKNLIDFFNCQSDIKNRQINIVSEKTFLTDPLRILRAFRIAGELNFTISKNTMSHIKKYSKTITKSASERIKNEFFRILGHPDASAQIMLMEDLSVLEALFPAVSAMKKSAKNFYYHPKGLFQHCFQTLQSFEKILSNLDKYFPDTKDRLSVHLHEKFSDNVNRISLLKFIALFHDCAKPECAKKIDKKMRFLGHETLGAEKTAEIMKNLKMSNKEIDYAKNIISEHMRPSNLAKSQIITNKARFKLFRDIKDNTPDVLLLAMADWHSYKSLKVYSRQILKRQEKAVAELISDYFKFKDKKPQAKVLDGNLLMKKFSLKPGKIVGEMLRLINIQCEQGKITDKKQALIFAKSKLTLLRKKHKI